MHRLAGILWRAIALTFALLLAIQLYPKILFGHTRSYRGFDVASDRPIDAAITGVIDDAHRRLQTSVLISSDERFRIFICNSRWRLKLFTGNGSLGGGTVYATRNIFLAAVDIPANTLHPLNGKALLDQPHRPLSYFIAHEATHVLELRRYGLFAMLRAPFWLVEGYADHVAKADDFDIDKNRELLRQGDPLLAEQVARNGLYRRYQLLVETALARNGTTIDTLFADPPSKQDLLAEASR